jgi:hypothetical protein
MLKGEGDRKWGKNKLEDELKGKWKRERGDSDTEKYRWEMRIRKMYTVKAKIGWKR